ncbi:hypothetical protein E4U55_000968 [Claviceps digitariae]|nr:hypothetical protein E4U55_000968 [Claviceps digitariae]
MQLRERVTDETYGTFTFYDFSKNGLHAWVLSTGYCYQGERKTRRRIVASSPSWKPAHNTRRQKTPSLIPATAALDALRHCTNTQSTPLRVVHFEGAWLRPDTIYSTFGRSMAGPRDLISERQLIAPLSV